MDILLTKLFETQRWTDAINKGLEKSIDKDLLRSLTDPAVRIRIYRQIRDKQYIVAPPHEARIPKEDGTYRTVYVNENMDRVLLSIINDLFFELCPELIHRNCVSYQKGIGCGKIVQRTAKIVSELPDEQIGVKIDLSKYFDSVPINYIDDIFDYIDKKFGKSVVTDIVRDYYHMNTVLDINKQPVEKYSSLRQGCAVAAFLADTVLFDIDNTISGKYNVYYVRYSDDILILGKDWQDAYNQLKQMLEEKGLRLNPKKIEILSKYKWFRFLGFTIKGQQISLSAPRIKSFQKEIMNRTVKSKSRKLSDIVQNVHEYLYMGTGEYSWSTSVLPIVNVLADINTMNNYIMDAIRAAVLNKKDIGGLGFTAHNCNGTIMRGKGRNVKSNRLKIPEISGYRTLKCMQNAMNTSKAAYDILVRTMA